MVVAKAFLSRYTSYVAIASRRTLNSPHPSGFTTPHFCSLLSSRSHHFNGIRTGIVLTLDLTGTVQAQLTLKTLASWLPAVTISMDIPPQFSKMSSAMKTCSLVLCYLEPEEMQSWYAVKAATSAAYPFTSIWLPILNEDIPLALAFAGLLCV